MRRDWSAIGVEFISSNMTLEEFATHKDIPYNMVARYSARNKWMDKRQDTAKKTSSAALELVVEDKASTLAKFDNRMLSIVNGLALQVEAGVVGADEPNKVKILSAAAKDLQHIYRLALGASTENQSVKSVEDFEAFVNEKLSGLDFKQED